MRVWRLIPLVAVVLFAVTLKVTVPATSHGGYFGAGTYNIGPAINAGSPLNVRISGAGSNVTKPNITLS